MPEALNYFLPYQLAWIEDPSPFAIGEKSRRIGWTYASSYRAVERRVRGLSNLYFSSADFTAGREFIGYCKTWCEVFNAVAQESEETEVIDDREIHTMVLTFANGKKIVAGSSNPTFFRSKGGDADGDEFAFHRNGRELIKAMHATALFWGHQLRLWSTHNGDGSYFNGMIKDARSGKLKARVQKVTILDAVEQGLVEKIKKLSRPDAKARQDWLDELRSTCPDQQTWDEEYLCIPSSEANSLLTYELIRACERADADLKIVDDPRQLATNCPMYYGMDVGRHRDLTAIFGGCRVGDVVETRLIKTFAKTDYTTQEQYVDLLMRNGARRICIDSTGIGDMLAERLQQRHGKYRVESVHFTPEVKSELAMPMVSLFQDRLIRIPDSAELREDLHKVRKIVTAAGNVRFDAAHDDAGHADRFWALGLMVAAMDINKQPRRAALTEMPLGW
jgi:phage FluMu gp28-like protein